MFYPCKKFLKIFECSKWHETLKEAKSRWHLVDIDLERVGTLENEAEDWSRWGEHLDLAKNKLQ